jgi:hypothetical protein
MHALIYSKETLVWLALSALTVASWLLAADHGQVVGGAEAGASLLMVLACFKVRLVMLYFMETKHAPLMLRLSCEVWVFSTCALLVVLNMGLLGEIY